MDPNVIIIGLVWYVVFLFSTTCHEASHALAAKLGGDLTAFEGGQVTLDPMPHIRREPFGMVLVPLLTFFSNGWMMGWASAPYDPYWAQRHPRRAAWMSLAGPAANLSLSILAAVLIRIGLWAGVFSIPDRLSFTHVTEAATNGPWAVAALILSILFQLNLLLAFFNLLPLPPLDGSGVITLFMNRSMISRWNALIRQPMFGLLGLLVAWTIFGPIFSPIRWFAIGLLYPGVEWI